MNSSKKRSAVKTAKLDLLLQREQIAENLRFARLAMFAGCFNAVVAVIALWGAGHNTVLIGWAAAVWVGGIFRLITLYSGSIADRSEGMIRRQRRWIDVIALYNGVIWGLGVASMAFIASNPAFVLIIILCSGMMGASVTTYTSLARSGLLFVTPLALGGLVALWAHPMAPSIPGTILLGCYYLLLVGGGQRRQERFLQRITAEVEARQNESTVQLLLNDFEAQAADWLWQVDDNGCIIEPTDRFAQAAGQAVQLLDGKPLADLLDDGSERAIFSDHIDKAYRFRNLTVRLTIGGEPHWWTLSGQPTPGGGMRGVASDVTGQKRAEERVKYMAHYDGLTDLANRFVFNDNLNRVMQNGVENGELAVLCLDLDSFKTVNDTLGHPAGDQLLAETARRLQSAVGEDDLIARLGGDEFAVLLRGTDAADRADIIGAHILEQVAIPFDLSGAQVITSTSIGVAIVDTEDLDAEGLMKRADLALYSAKEAGRNRLAHYAAGMDEAAQNRRELEMDLRAALIEGQFDLHYQPLINIETGKTVAYEALIRWNHPVRGVVMPDDFIPLAEETGLIVQMGEWVIRQACEEVSLWADDMRVSVNLSPIQMRSSNLLNTIFNAVANTGIAPSQLELEITENVLMHDTDVNLTTLHKIHEFGVRIALDDFGTGYSSLNYLRSFPFDKIKIDRCFVGDLENNADCRAIVRAVTGLATSMGMQTTAEGVEDADQLEQLRAEGCTEAQGFLFSRPERADQFTDLRAREPNQSTTEIEPIEGAKPPPAASYTAKNSPPAPARKSG